MPFKDKEREKEYNKEYRKKNFDKIRQKQNEYLNKPEVKEHLKICKQEWYQKNKTEQNKKAYKRTLKDKIEHREKYIWKYAKYRAKTNNLEFSIVIDDIKIPIKCPILDIELSKEIGGKHKDNTPSIDRIDNNKGYIKDNIRIISYRANSLKSDSSFDELEKLYQDAKSLREARQI